MKKFIDKLFIFLFCIVLYPGYLCIAWLAMWAPIKLVANYHNRLWFLLYLFTIPFYCIISYFIFGGAKK